MGNRADEEQRVEEALQDFFALYRIGETEEAESQWSNVESLIRELGAPPPAVIGVLVARAEFHTKRREFFAV